MSHIPPLVNGDTYATLRAYFNGLYDDVAVINDIITKHDVTSKTVSSITTANLFNIADGPIKVVDIIGFITTVIAAGANNTKLVYTSTGGAAIDLCAVANIASTAVRKNLSITGVKANALQVSADDGVTVRVLGSVAHVILQPGIISMNCLSTTTGAIKWDLLYEPINVSATVTAL